MFARSEKDNRGLIFSKLELDVFRFVLAAAEQMLGTHDVWLFGSRARRDHKDRSDFDIAISFPHEYAHHWGTFVAHIEDFAPTLCSFDLLNLNEASEDSSLFEKVRSEGIRIGEVLQECACESGQS